MSLDPATRKVRDLAQLSDFAVSPDGQWFAGDGAGPRGSQGPRGSHAYVLSADARKCLVVPGYRESVRGFTRDSKAVIVLRAYTYPETRLIQFPLSSLRTGCPAGPNGVLPQKG